MTTEVSTLARHVRMARHWREDVRRDIRVPLDAERYRMRAHAALVSVLTLQRAVREVLRGEGILPPQGGFH